MITCAPGTLSSTNYSFVTGTKGDLTIEKATLAVNADDQTKTYGDADPTATWSYSGFVNGDTAGSVTVSGAAACSYAAHSANAGSYPNVITCAPGTLKPTNYSFVTGTKGDLTIEKATLAVNADDQTKAYGDADPTATWSYSGFVNGDTAGSVTVSGAAACSYAAHSANAGSYPNVITCAPGTLSSTNYSFVTGTKGDLTIEKATLAVNADDQGEDLRRCRPDGDLELQRLRQRRHRRQRHGQRRGRLQLRRPLGQRRQLPERDHLRAGHADLDQLQLRDRHQGRPDDREGDPGRQRRRPDEDLRRCRPDGDLELQRLRQRRHRRQRHGQRRGRLQLRRPLGQRRQLPDVITCAPGTLDSTNYSFVTGTKGDLTIEKATLAVNADDQTKTYGDADPTATWSYSGFVNGDTAGSVTVSGAAACSYPRPLGQRRQLPDVITCAPGTLSSTNYSFVTGTKGDLTIEKATLAVNADDQTKTYGDADPTATWSYSGFVNGDTAGSVTVSGAAACSYAAHSANAGSYPNVITCAPGTLSSTNYSFVTGTKGDLTIEKATLAVNADDQTKTYGDADPTATWSYSGFVNGDTAGSVTVSGAAACSYAAHSANAGSYPNVITCAPGTLSSTTTAS